jgi:hypothetical protein
VPVHVSWKELGRESPTKAEKRRNRLLALEDMANIDAGLTVGVGIARSIAHQAAGLGVFARLVDGGNRVAGRQPNELFAAGSLFPRTVPRLVACCMSARPEYLRQLARKCAIKAAATKNSAARASFEAERKQLLRLAEQAERGRTEPKSFANDRAKEFVNDRAMEKVAPTRNRG